MNQWVKYLAVIVGVPALVFALALTAFSVTTEQTGISGKQVYSYDTVTGFARMQVVIKDILVLAGGEHVGATEDEGFQRTVGGPTRAYALLTDILVDGSGATTVLPVGGKTFFSKIVGSAGAQSATITVWGDYKSTATEEFLICTMSLSGTSEDAKKCTGITEDYKYYHAKIASISGTDATVNVWSEMGFGGGSGSGGGGDVTNAGTFAVQSTSEPCTGVEDAVETAGGCLKIIGTVRRDTAASSAGTTGDNATANTDGLGRMWVREGSPCADHARITSATISESTAATNEIVALSGSDLIYVCGYKFVTTAANSLSWTRGTGTDCGTGTTAIEGAQPYAANGGATEHGGGYPLFIVPAGNALCLVSSAATAHGGRVTYVRTAAP